MAGILVYAGFAVLWSTAPGTYAKLLWMADAMPQDPKPYNDLAAIIQAASCWRGGVNVYATNSCMDGGSYNYSPFLLATLHLPADHCVNSLVGAGLGITFLAALALLPPAQSRTELVFRTLATLSSDVIFALERANLDVAIFLLVLCGVLLVLTHHWPAILGYLLFLFAAACKFYPVALLALLLREPPRYTVPALACLSAIGLLYLTLFGAGSLTALRTVPVGLPFSGMFGAINLPFGLVLLHLMPAPTLTPDAKQFLAGLDDPHAGMLVHLGLQQLLLSALLAAVLLARRYSASFAALDTKSQMFLVAGAILMLFCFMLAQNIAYRSIFLLLTLPGLWRIAAGQLPRTRARQRILPAFVVLLLWQSGLRHLADSLGDENLHIAVWLAFECIWWWVMIQFGAFIVCFLQQSIRPDMRDDRAAGLAMHG